MCGIFGWQYRDLSKTKRAVVAACLSNEMEDRGSHSWGHYALESDILTKGIGAITSSVSAEDVGKNRSLIGHTRHATTGKVIVDNAHPFRLQSIVGCHNGMVANHSYLNLKYKRDCAVDSQHIFHHLEMGESEAEISAYGAIAHTVPKSGKITLSVFNGGELCAAFGKFGVLFASTRSAAKKALALAGIKGHLRELRETVVYVITDGKIYETEETYAPSPYRSAGLSLSGAMALTRGETEYADEKADDENESDWWEKWDAELDREYDLLKDSYYGKQI